MLRSAVLSSDGRHRYRLTRRWGDGPALAFLMLNPSTADAERDDPTIRRCARFSRDSGYAALEVVNLFALRSADPRGLMEAALLGEDVRGPENAGHLLAAFVCCPEVICAWGAFSPTLVSARLSEVLDGLTLAGAGGLLLRRTRCLGRTRSGAPRHPLYVPASVRPEPYDPWDGYVPAF